jgi:hypothetical protein
MTTFFNVYDVFNTEDELNKGFRIIRGDSCAMEISDNDFTELTQRRDK